jgi:hypothetical protein
MPRNATASGARACATPTPHLPGAHGGGLPSAAGLPLARVLPWRRHLRGGRAPVTHPWTPHPPRPPRPRRHLLGIEGQCDRERDAVAGGVAMRRGLAPAGGGGAERVCSTRSSSCARPCLSARPPPRGPRAAPCTRAAAQSRERGGAVGAHVVELVVPEAHLRLHAAPASRRQHPGARARAGGRKSARGVDAGRTSAIIANISTSEVLQPARRHLSLARRRGADAGSMGAGCTVAGSQC